MKKRRKTIRQKKQEDDLTSNMLQEPVAIYRPVKVIHGIQSFSYSKFEKIARRIPFTQREWASILHLSEKTLQRYAKDNKSFEGIYVDRILHLESLIDMGLEVFTDADVFYEWLKKDKPVLGEILNFDSLTTTHGIELLKNQLGRILHGVYI
jgi:putative toxin-antitoxin system antitoxin component (TIGR02293 family)